MHERKRILMVSKNNKPKVLYRYCDDMEHVIVYQNGILLSDEYEGFPKLSAKDILECLVECGVIELEQEEIIE